MTYKISNRNSEYFIKLCNGKRKSTYFVHRSRPQSVALWWERWYQHRTKEASYYREPVCCLYVSLDEAPNLSSMLKLGWINTAWPVLVQSVSVKFLVQYKLKIWRWGGMSVPCSSKLKYRWSPTLKLDQIWLCLELELEVWVAAQADILMLALIQIVHRK